MVRLQKCWPHCCASIKGKRTQPVAWGRRGSISSNWRLATLQRKPCVQRHMRAPGWLSAIDPLTVHEVRREDVASSPRSSANRPAVANLPAFRQHSRARCPANKSHLGGVLCTVSPKPPFWPSPSASSPPHSPRRSSSYSDSDDRLAACVSGHEGDCLPPGLQGLRVAWCRRSPSWLECRPAFCWSAFFIVAWLNGDRMIKMIEAATVGSALIVRHTRQSRRVGMATQSYKQGIPRLYVAFILTPNVKMLSKTKSGARAK